MLQYVILLQLFFIFNIHTTFWGDEIWFSLPSNGQPISGNMEIKIYQPPHNVEINVWIEDKRSEQVVWIGTVSPERNYSITVDTTKFKPGSYEIKALYYMYGEDFEGDIDIWINSP